MQHVLNVEADQPLQRFSILLDQSQALRSELDHAYESARKDPFSAREALALAVDLLDQLDELRGDIGEVLLKLMFSGDAAKASELLAKYGAPDGPPRSLVSSVQSPQASAWIEQVSHTELSVVLGEAEPEHESAEVADDAQALAASVVELETPDEPMPNAAVEELSPIAVEAQPTKKRPSIATVERSSDAPIAAPISVEAIARKQPEQLAEVLEKGQPLKLEKGQAPPSAEALERLRQMGIGGNTSMGDEIPAHLLRISNEDDGEILEALQHSLKIVETFAAAPETVSTSIGFEAMIQRLPNHFGEQSMNHLLVLPKEIHNLTLSAGVAYLCHLRDLAELHAGSYEAYGLLDAAFRASTKSSNQVYSGHIYGLRSGCEVPEGCASWFDYLQERSALALPALKDAIQSKSEKAQTASTDVRRVMERKVQNRAQIPELSPTLKNEPVTTFAQVEAIQHFAEQALEAIRDQKAKDRAAFAKQLVGDAKIAWNQLRNSEFKNYLLVPPMQELLAQIHAFDPDFEPERWVHWDRTRGKRMLVLGGLRVEEEIAEIERFFGFEQVDWEPHRGTEGYKRIQGRMEQITNGTWDFAACTIKSSGHSLTNMIQGAVSSSRNTTRIDVDGFRTNSFAIAFCRAFNLELTADGFFPDFQSLTPPDSLESTTERVEASADSPPAVEIETARTPESSVAPNAVQESPPIALDQTEAGISEEEWNQLFADLRFVLAKLDIRLPNSNAKIGDIEKLMKQVEEAGKPSIKEKLLRAPELMQAEYAVCISTLARRVHYHLPPASTTKRLEQKLHTDADLLFEALEAHIEGIRELELHEFWPDHMMHKVAECIDWHRDGWREVLRAFADRRDEFAAKETLLEAMESARLAAIAAARQASEEARVVEESVTAAEEKQRAETTTRSGDNPRQFSLLTLPSNEPPVDAREQASDETTAAQGPEPGDAPKGSESGTRALLRELANSHSETFLKHFAQDALPSKNHVDPILGDVRKLTSVLRTKGAFASASNVQALSMLVEKLSRLLDASATRNVAMPYLTFAVKFFVVTFDIQAIAQRHWRNMKRTVTGLAKNVKEIIELPSPLFDEFLPIGVSSKDALQILSVYFREAARRNEMLRR